MSFIKILPGHYSIMYTLHLFNIDVEINVLLRLMEWKVCNIYFALFIWYSARTGTSYYTREYYTGTKKKELLPSVWMNLEIIMLC